MSAQYFAQLDQDNKVIHVSVVTAEFMAANPERYPGTWVETFIDETHTYAGIGYTYDYNTQDFTAPIIEVDDDDEQEDQQSQTPNR